MTRTFALHRHPHYNYDGSQLYNNSTLSNEHLSKGLPLQIVIYTYAAHDNIIPQLNVHTCKRCNTPHCFHLSSKVIQEKQQRATCDVAGSIPSWNPHRCLALRDTIPTWTHGALSFCTFHDRNFNWIDAWLCKNDWATNPARVWGGFITKYWLNLFGI